MATSCSASSARSPRRRAEITGEHRVAIEQAEADFAQDEFPAGQRHRRQGADRLGDRAADGRDHWIVFMLKEPIRGEATPWLRLVLSQNHGLQHTLGRFRVIGRHRRRPAVSACRRTCAAILAVRRRQAHRRADAGARRLSASQQDKAARERDRRDQEAPRAPGGQPVMKARAHRRAHDKRAHEPSCCTAAISCSRKARCGRARWRCCRRCSRAAEARPIGSTWPAGWSIRPIR